MSYGMIVSGTDLQRLQEEVNAEFSRLARRIKDLEDKAVKPDPKKPGKIKDILEKA
jgi:hypothetical protein